MHFQTQRSLWLSQLASPVTVAHAVDLTNEKVLVAALDEKKHPRAVAVARVFDTDIDDDRVSVQVSSDVCLSQGAWRVVLQIITFVCCALSPAPRRRSL